MDVKIKPNDDNDINPQRPGVLPVSVHHTTDFDRPAELDPSTVRFGAPDTVSGADGAKPSHDGGHIEDVNGDSDNDWIGHFTVQDTGFESGDNEGKLIGETTDDEPIPVFGFDDVNLVGGRAPVTRLELKRQLRGYEKTNSTILRPSGIPAKIWR